MKTNPYYQAGNVNTEELDALEQNHKYWLIASICVALICVAACAGIILSW